ncbi:MAG: phosphatase PAP2 family protein [Candidatus Zambryskibacteria bacterium]|nr:phosphatase PAP2 family protein [Candidatus Zambryskibacteria bacterium]
MVPNWAKNILFLLIYMISGLVLVVIIEGLLSGSDLTPLNTVVEKFVVHMRTPLLTTFLVWVTTLWNPFILSCLAVLMASLLAMRGYIYDAILFLIGLLVTVVSLTILKNVFQITRPISDVYIAGGWSFPSGHATVATAFFFLLGHTFFGKVHTTAKRISLIIGSIVATVIVSFSRLYLGAHWTLDILAGVALGLLCVSFTVLMFNIFFGSKRSLRRFIDM